MRRLWRLLLRRVRPVPVQRVGHWVGGSLEAEVEGRAKALGVGVHGYAEDLRGEQVVVFHQLAKLQSILAEYGLMKSAPKAARTIKWAIGIIQAACRLRGRSVEAEETRYCDLDHSYDVCAENLLIVEEENAGLRASLKRNDKRLSEALSTTAEACRLQAKVEKRCKSLRASASNDRDRASDFILDIRNLNHESKQRLRQIKEQQGEIDRLQKQLKTQAATIRSLEGTCESFREQIPAAIDGSTARIKKLKRQVSYWKGRAKRVAETGTDVNP